MGTMNSEAPSIPGSLEPVRIRWAGLHDAGLVAKVYRHVIDGRPMVVVDQSPYDPDGSDYVTVNVSSVEPEPGAETPWARTYWYQRDVLAAFARAGVEATPCPSFAGWPHLRVDGAAGRVAVELQPVVPRRYPLARARQALRADPSLAGVLIVARDDREPPRDRRLRVVRWKDRRDDRRLATALADLTG